MKTKAAKIFSCCKYEIIIFAVLLIQAVSNLILSGGAGEYTSVYYLSDYSMGINSRLLVGSIVSLFNDSPSIEWISGFSIVVLVLTLLAVSILTGKVVRNTQDELKPQLYVLIAFMITGSFTFSFFSKFLGLLDIHTFIIALIAVVCAYSKKTRWLVPLLCVLGVLAHNIFAISYFPMVFLVLFYFLVKENNKAYSAAMLVISFVITAVLTVYFTVYAGDHMNITFDEFREIINEKSTVEISDTFYYGIGFHLFNVVGADVNGFAAGTPIEVSLLETLKGVIGNVINLTSVQSISTAMIVYVLFLTAFWTIWIKCLRNAETKASKFVYICFMLVPLAELVAFVVTPDFVRWIQAAVLTQFCFILTMFITKDRAFEETMQQLREYFSNKKLVLAIIYLIYLFTIQTDIA